jgi:RimJ/RimL family protein N-acetyltransferase
MTNNINVKIAEKADIHLIMDYWFGLNAADLMKMGADIQKLPSRAAFTDSLLQQLALPIAEKNAFIVIWELDGIPVGHSNTNPTTFGDFAFMHLHLWKNPNRQKGLGTAFLKKTIPLYFEHLQLKNLYCQPYSLNPAPNKTLEKVGFEFEKTYITTPGSINFEQSVNLWKMSVDSQRS